MYFYLGYLNMATGNVLGDHFDSQHLQEIFIFGIVQSNFGALRFSCPVGLGRFLPGGKEARA